MIDNRMLAIYCFLREIGVCRQAEEVFDHKVQPGVADVDYILHLACKSDIGLLVTQLWAAVPVKNGRRVAEDMLIEFAYLYVDDPRCDNTFLLRFQSLMADGPIVWWKDEPDS
jgi:hypothetical protein